jgi:pyruvate dehydrogenase E2 component (dihydrolipoyllysine-residue acetyltransferase)
MPSAQWWAIVAEFRMPSLGADMEEGTVLQWLVKPGDSVKRGDIVAVVDTEKATIEVEIFQAGVVDQIVVPEGEKVPVGTVLAIVRAEGEAPAVKPAPAPAPKPAAVAAPEAAPAPAAAPAPRAAVPQPSPPKVEIAVPPPGKHRTRISPLAMRVALKLGVDISKIAGTGIDGAITKSDVERAAKQAPAAPPPKPAPAAAAPQAAPLPQPVERKVSPMAPAERMAAMRKVIAAAMSRSKREIPHYYLGTEIDMSRAMAWLREENLKRSVTERLLYSVMLLKAAALAVKRVPEINGFWIDGALRRSDDIHAGVAISMRGGGLIAPAIHDVGKKSLGEIMKNLRDLVQRVRAGVLRSSEIADATITVTSLGEEGVETVFGIIYPPQVALVGFGKIVERPWAKDGMIGAHPIMRATLAADHRATDGHRGALFLAAIDRLLQEPEKL